MKTGAKIIHEYGDQSFATDTLSLEEMIDTEIGKVLERLDELLNAAKNVVMYVDGELPMKGWLPDNDSTRCSLHRLKEAIQKAEAV